MPSEYHAPLFYRYAASVFRMTDVMRDREGTWSEISLACQSDVVKIRPIRGRVSGSTRMPIAGLALVGFWHDLSAIRTTIAPSPL